MKDFRPLSRHQQGVTEIIGTMLLLGISVSLFSVVYFSVLSAPAPTSTPSAQIVGSLDLQNNQIIFHHNGGEPISGNSRLLIHKGDSVNEILLSDYVGEKWEMGETINHSIYNINDTYLDALIIDTNSNSIVSSAVLQKGYSTTNPFVKTSTARNIQKKSATLEMGYDFVTSSGNLFFMYRKQGSTDPWINTSLSNIKTGYGTYTKEISNLEIHQSYEFKAVMKNQSNHIFGNVLTFTTAMPLLDTLVDDLPETITDSTFNISATGDPDLDSVTLYYRYSTDDGSTWETSGSMIDWWDTSWNKRKKFTITGNPNESLTDYPIPITVHYSTGEDNSRHVYLNNSCKTDFSDIRFVTESGDTLPYYLEQKINADKAMFWVSIDSIPKEPANTVCYLYYDNAAAVSESDGFSTFSSFEDFEEQSFIFDTAGDSGIQLSQSSSDPKQGSNCAKHDNTNQDYHVQMQDNDQFNAQSHEFGAWVRINSGWANNDGLGPAIAFCCEPGTNKGYQIIIDAREADSPQIRIDTEHSGNKRVDGDYQVSNNEWYFISGYKNGNKVIGNLYSEDQYYDGIPQTSTEKISNDYQNGYHGLFVYGMNHQFWDAVRVRKHVNDEPTISSWNESDDQGWAKWEVDENPSWYWNFDFSEHPGYYEFISIGKFKDNQENWPETADQNCSYSTD
ncbi:MAG: DUF2341 domain-containing protein [Candidatus Thermoplasmatota archaeon]|nr:DUF2341 domain-containing protein [Candidatus Thermoplasmatota archaeon]